MRRKKKYKVVKNDCSLVRVYYKGFVPLVFKMKKAAVPLLVVGRDGRMEKSSQLRVQDVVVAFELLHSDAPDSEQKLAELLVGEQK
jgi:hypothetical protein